jgi:hypothetical protein
MKSIISLKRLLLSCTAVGIIASVVPATATTNLIHRYSFNESPGSTTVTDSIRGSNGVARVVNNSGGSIPTFDGAEATLDGVGGYIDLPNRMVSGLTNLSVEAWITWESGGTWARIFDFGTNNLGEDFEGTNSGFTGGRYVFLTVTAGTNPRFAISATDPPNGNTEPTVINSSVPLTTGPGVAQKHHVVVAYGPAGGRMYIDGNLVGSTTVYTPLSNVRDVNNWLGRANWPDPLFGGKFDEFRIHSSVLGQLEVLASRESGPNAIGYTPENPNSIVLNVNSNMSSGQVQNPTLTAEFPTYGTVTVGANEGSLSSSATGVVRVGANNQLTAVSPGTAQITATLGGQTSQATITVVAPSVAVNQLKHRYSFNDPNGSATVNDSVGDADGTVIPSLGTTAPVLITNGIANFPGGGNNARATSGYISLPPNLLSTDFTNITVEMWFTWRAGANSTWQRVWDFGDSNKGNDARANNTGRDYIMFTPQRGGDGARSEFRATLDAGANFTSVNLDAAPMGPAPAFPTNREVHVVVTHAPQINYSAMYIDGRSVDIENTPIINGEQVQFSQVSSPNMWLGLGQWFDPPLNGSINELRLHEGLMDEVQIALSRQAGPDGTPISNPGTLQSIALDPTALFINNPLTTQAILRGNFQNVTNVDITPFTGVSFQSTDTNVFTVDNAGLMRPVALGTANLIGSYNSMSVTSQVSVLSPSSVSYNNLPATLDVGNAAHSPYAVPLLATFPGGISNVDVSGFTGVTRASSDTNVATINAAGSVTVLNPGTTTITGTYAGQSANAQLTVLAPISLTVTNLPTTKQAGSTNFTVPLLASYSDGNTNINVSAATGVARDSSNPNVATISGGGVITVRSPGVTTISSSYRGITNQALLTVVSPPGFVAGTLLHRWSFSEAPDTTTVEDSVGDADGTVVAQQFGLTNGNFTGTGEFMFGPGPYQEPPITNAYINLPNGLISSLTDVTVEGWGTFFGGANNQRFFDFGISSGAPDGSGGTNSTNYLEDFVLNPGRNYFFLSPQQGAPRFALDPDTGNTGIGETPSITSSINITNGAKSHFAVVYEFSRGVARLYINGRRAGTGLAVYPLSRVDDRNNWIGRSQWQDPYYNGTIDEFRIYNGPFLDSDIAEHFAAGPNALPVPRPTLSIRQSGNQLTISWPTSFGNFALKTSSALGGEAVWTSAGTPVVNGGNNEVTVTATGTGAFYRLEQQ